MEQNSFHHALKIVTEACIGCCHCMKVCPTEAIRVRSGKAKLIENRCVDCGMCFRACPVNAIIIEQDDFNSIFDYKYRVALVPAVFIGQFPDNIMPEAIFSELIKLGFTHIHEVEHGAAIIRNKLDEFIKCDKSPKPLISSFCPGVVRLIQVKFPSLTENIARLKAPLDMAAIYYKELLIQQGAEAEEIGIFYITPCAAKIAAVKSPVGEANSPINGVINMDTLFNKTYRSLKTHKAVSCPLPEQIQSPDAGNISWSLTRGESKQFDCRQLAVDEIHNVMEFLEKLENDEITDIDFLELRACDESCAGGVLTTENRFLTVERMLKRSYDAKMRKNTIDLKDSNNLNKDISQQAYVGEVSPRSMHILDVDMNEAMRKMSKINELIKSLPGVDCGVCGAPNCATLAEDIVQGRAKLTHCIFIQRSREFKGIISEEESMELMKEIWGKGKIKRK